MRTFVIRMMPVLCCSMALPAHAEDRFYQVVDPDGSVRTIEIPAEAPQAAPSPARPQTPAEPDKKTDAADAPAPAVTEPGVYDSDVYVDSEVFEQSGFNAKKKKKFFLMRDAAGGYVQQPDASDTVPAAATDSPPVAVAAAPAADLPDEQHVIDPASLPGAFSTLPKCFSRRDLRRATEVRVGSTYPVLMDGKTRLFVPDHGLVAAYHQPAAGSGSFLVRSYAKSDQQPGFARPYLAFTRQDGCITRLLTGYFRHSYEATQSRHAMLETSITVEAGERYLLVIKPGAGDGITPPQTYSLSPDGQLGIKWQP